nr:PREDICTED: nucleoporin NUP53 [Bemisia tabaci]XP_018901456.1 PREDICTED: nucleoporin NUP53 [Bemisia tabaci]
MEPMTLGSPMVSPANSPLVSPNSSAYLPSFLMGSEQPHFSSSSPTKRTTRSPTYATNESFSLSLSQKMDKVNRATQEVKEKPGGPPTVGLFDTLHSFDLPKSRGADTFRLQAGARQAIRRNSFSPMGMSSPVVQSQTVSENNTDNSWAQKSPAASAEHWVTVFGFPPSAASLVLAYFSQIGRVEETKQPNHGNWMNIRYYSKMDARRAVYQNGKVFSGSIMVGVAPCKDTSILKDVTNNISSVSPEKPSLTHRIISNIASKVLPSAAQGTPSDESSFQSPASSWASPEPVTPSIASPSNVTPKSILKSAQTNRASVRSWQPRSVSFQDSSMSATPEQPRVQTPSSIRKLMSPLSPVGAGSSLIQNNDNEVVLAHNIPRKSSSVVSKTIDYFLGW